ncbi:Helicase associated domain protein [Alphaproteobacteria bacterium]|nr:Helicase associated domain protein [Alphaproteobacteria bacterium]
MGALNRRTGYWVAQGIFDNLQSFKDLEQRITALPGGIKANKDRGDVFEIFIEGYLATQQKMQYEKHWVVGNIPALIREKYGLKNTSRGIDGIYKANNTDVVYQVKFESKTKRHHLALNTPSSFFTITADSFSRNTRMIFTNCLTADDDLKAKSLCTTGEVFNALSSIELHRISKWICEKPELPIKAMPDPRYQLQVLKDIRSCLKENDRATVVMACGTGKTLVSLWAAEQEKPNTILVLLPSLILVRQTLREWAEQTSLGEKFSYLCVCSDETIARNYDSWSLPVEELEFAVTTDPSVVTQFLKRSDNKVKIIFSTYQSSPIIGKAIKDLPPFDIAIFDEAHKTVGWEGKDFSFALLDQNISIKKRLFFTATPRIYNVPNRDQTEDFKSFSMDNADIYGPRAHTLSFASAIKKDITCRYKVIISLIDKKMVDDFTLKNGVTIIEGTEVTAHWAANQIALKKAIKKSAASKIISFHSRVERASSFASKSKEGFGRHLKTHKVLHINGTQNSRVREEALEFFNQSKNAIITNARCLTEGVNLPTIDMVAFMDPKKSRVDIAQAVGRAMRKPRGESKKTVGYVLVPLFCDSLDPDSQNEIIEEQGFDVVTDVINALQDYDEDLAEIIRELKFNKGLGRGYRWDRFKQKIEFDGPPILIEKLTESISVQIVESIGSNWDHNLGLLTQYQTKYGHCIVPRDFEIDGIKLGRWVGVKSRERKLNRLSQKQINDLDVLGFVWDRFTWAWEEGFTALENFRSQHGHCRVTATYKDANNFNLGTWVSTQRIQLDEIKKNAKRDLRISFSVLKERRRRLDEIGFSWDAAESKWFSGYDELVKFYEREKHCRPPRNYYVDESKFRLDSWVLRQRRFKKALNKKQIALLNKIDFDWDPDKTDFEAHCKLLQNFKEREGHCDVPHLHKENGFGLYHWITRIKQNPDRLPLQRKNKLIKIGVHLAPRTDPWEEGYKALLIFQKREGHCVVPISHKEDGFSLGSWVGAQRQKYKGQGKIPLTEQQIEKLKKLDFDWDPKRTQWMLYYDKLLQYKTREKNTEVPEKHHEDNLPLGRWVTGQRKRWDLRSEEEKSLLLKIGFRFGKIEDPWDNNFEKLVWFQKKYGHCNVHGRYEIDGFSLGTWVQTQRQRKKGNGKQFPLTKEQIKKLDQIRFDWDRLASDWNRGYEAFLSFKKREGHIIVPKGHIEDGVKLGSWFENQKKKLKGKGKGTLTNEQVKKLNAVGLY